MQERLQREEEAKQAKLRYEQLKARNLEKFLRKYDNKRLSHYIPAIHMPYTIGSSKVLIYFHANAEDIVLCNELLDYMRALLKVNIIAIEYPGYGIYAEKFQKRSSKFASMRNPPGSREPKFTHLISGVSGLESPRKEILGKTPRFGEDSSQKLKFGSSTKKPLNLENSRNHSAQKSASAVSGVHKSYNFSLESSDEELEKELNNKKWEFDDESLKSDDDGKTDDGIHEQYNDLVFEANEENILDDALYAYDYINLVLGIEESNIIIFGRSMGSGPATHVASKRNPASLLLMSSFKSIRDIA